MTTEINHTFYDIEMTNLRDGAIKFVGLVRNTYTEARGLMLRMSAADGIMMRVVEVKS